MQQKGNKFCIKISFNGIQAKSIIDTAAKLGMTDYEYVKSVSLGQICCPCDNCKVTLSKHQHLHFDIKKTIQVPEPCANYNVIKIKKQKGTYVDEAIKAKDSIRLQHLNGATITSLMDKYHVKYAIIKGLLVSK